MVRQEHLDEAGRHAKKAVELAVQGLWKEAIAANMAVLDLAPEDVEAYNRLGRAYLELGEHEAARQAYGKALELDQYNSIAKKNLKRLAELGDSMAKDDHHQVVADGFVEDTSKARVVQLVNPAPRETIMQMVPGAKVDLRVEGQRLVAHNEHNDYLGEVDPKYGPRLARLIQGGNQYVAAVRSLGDTDVDLLIKEVYEHPSQAGLVSFPPKKRERFRPYVKESLLRPREEAEDEEEAFPELPELETLDETSP